MKTIAMLQDDIGRAKADAERVKDLSGDNFAMTVSAGPAPSVYAERKAAGEAIKTLLLEKGARLWESSADVVLGQLSGFEIGARVRKSVGTLSYSLAAKGQAEYRRDDEFQLSETTDAVGLVRRIEGLLRGIPKLLAEREGELAKASLDLPRIERQLGTAGFARQERLAAVKQKVKDLEAALQSEPETVKADIAPGMQKVEAAIPGQDNSSGDAQIDINEAVTASKASVNKDVKTPQPPNTAGIAGDEKAAVLAARNRLVQKTARGRGR